MGAGPHKGLRLPRGEAQQAPGDARSASPKQEGGASTSLSLPPPGAESKGGRISLHDEANLLERLSERQSQLVLDLLRQAADVSTVEAENQQLASDLADSFDRIQEVHHRIRNHLQTVTGLLSAHELSEESPTARRALQKSVARLASIAAIHDLLTRDPASAMLELPELVPELAQHLLRSLDAEGRVSIAVEACALSLAPREATAFVLILTELISNALEHGFPGEAGGEISIRVSCDGGTAVLEVRDSGRGLPADFDLRKANHLGLGLASRLAERDLGGCISARNAREEAGPGPWGMGARERPPGPGPQPPAARPYTIFTVTFPNRSQGGGA